MSRELILSKDKENSYYRHFKGKWYCLLNIAQHTENEEKLVIYKAMYGDMGVYARPYKMFISKTDKKKYPNAEQEYRFMHITELKKQFGEEKTNNMIKKELKNYI